MVSYRVGGPALLPAPMEDLAQAIRFILEKADFFGVAQENYAVAGFSAGGHLVAEWGSDNVGYAAYGLPKPAAIFPVYPVIDMNLIVKRGGGFIQTIVGDDILRLSAYIVRMIRECFPGTANVCRRRSVPKGFPAV